MSLLTTGAADAGEVLVTGLPALPRVNLLPPEIAERARLRRLQLGLGAGVLGVAGAVTVLYLGAAGSVLQAQDELQVAGAAGDALRAQSSEFSGVLDVYAEAEQARALVTAALSAEVRYSQLLDRLSRSVPEGVWLRTAEFTQAAATAPAAATTPAATGSGAEPAAGTGTGLGTVTFSGVAFRHDDVARWLESLATEPGYADPTFSDSTATVVGGRSVVTFTSTVTLTPAALSQRWTSGGER